MAKAKTQSALEHGSQLLQSLSEEAVDTVKDLATDVRDEALELADAADQQVRDFGDTLADAIRARPYQAMGIALGIGCVIGLIMARRR